MLELTFDQIELASGGMSTAACMGGFIIGGGIIGGAAAGAAGFFTEGAAWGLIKEAAAIGAAGGTIVGDLVCY